jgi:O-antigen/teichoic acid export membrane protein
MMSGGTAVTALFNTLLVFLIPRLVSVEDFGYWRLFLLYAGYSGFLHLGFADGALLRWAGRPLEEFHDEIAPAMKFLTQQQLGVVIPASLIVAFLLPSPMNVIVIAILVVAVVINLATVLQYGLQGARIFKPVAIAMATPGGALLALTYLWHLHRTPSFHELIIFYVVAWTGVLVYLWTRVRPLRGAHSSDSAWSLGKTCIVLGWPIVLANGGLSLVQSADRIVVSSALPIYDFAQYSLASSMMFIPVTAIATVYRVFFSHVAALEHEGRARVYAHASRFLLLAWSVLLPYFFVLDVFVRHVLPNYVAALPAAGILLLGVIFLAGIQILHMSFAYLYGRQREFLLVTACALLVTFAVALVLAIGLRSLVAVALGEIAALALWWLANEWNLRKTTGQRWSDWLRLTSVFAWSTISYIVAMKEAGNVGLRIFIYYGLVAGCLALTCYPEIRMALKLLSRAYPWTLFDGTRA